METAALLDAQPDLDGDDGSLSPNEKGKRKRHKERKIGEVLDLVLKWRKLYAGTKNPRTGQIEKLSLEEAAKRVGVAKKSLDDYLLQIRSAKKMGFNFQEHSNERVGVLRSFVKKTKKPSTTSRGGDPLMEENEPMSTKSGRSKKITRGKEDYDDFSGDKL